MIEIPIQSPSSPGINWTLGTGLNLHPDHMPWFFWMAAARRFPGIHALSQAQENFALLKKAGQLLIIRVSAFWSLTRKMQTNSVLKEVDLSGSPPAVAITPPARSTWTGAQTIVWTVDSGTRYFAVEVSTDNGDSWTPLAVDLLGTTFTIYTQSLPDSNEVLVRVTATDGVLTSRDTAGPFAIHNPPVVASVYPAAGQVDVGIHEDVEVNFRDAMDSSSLHSGSFTLAGGLYGSVSGSISYDEGERQARFTPDIPLSYNTTYTAHISTSVMDAGGDPLPAGKTWSFTTGPDLLAPIPTFFSPGDGSFNVHPTP